MTAEQNKKSSSGNTGNIVVSFFIGLIIGAFLMWLGIVGFNDKVDPIAQHGVDDQAALQDDTALNPSIIGEIVTLSDSTTSGGDEYIIVPDQEVGGEVFVQNTNIAKAGWVVIHELTSEGALSNALGAQRFDAGNHSGKVSLLRVTEANVEYAAVLYRDNGDKRFDLDLDLPLRDSNQNIIFTKFLTM